MSNRNRHTELELVPIDRADWSGPWQQAPRRRLAPQTVSQVNSSWKKVAPLVGFVLILGCVIFGI